MKKIIKVLSNYLKNKIEETRISHCPITQILLKIGFLIFSFIKKIYILFKNIWNKYILENLKDIKLSIAANILKNKNELIDNLIYTRHVIKVHFNLFLDCLKAIWIYIRLSIACIQVILEYIWEYFSENIWNKYILENLKDIKLSIAANILKNKNELIDNLIYTRHVIKVHFNLFLDCLKATKFYILKFKLWILDYISENINKDIDKKSKLNNFINKLKKFISSWFKK